MIALLYKTEDKIRQNREYVNLKGFIQHLATLISGICWALHFSFLSPQVSFYSAMQEVKGYSASLENTAI